MTWAAWIVSLVPGLVARVLAALGMGVATITGLELVGSQIRAYVVSALTGLPADVAAIAGLAGLHTALNIVLGAIAARLALYAMQNSSRIVGLAK